MLNMRTGVNGWLMTEGFVVWNRATGTPFNLVSCVDMGFVQGTLEDIDGSGLEVDDRLDMEDLQEMDDIDFDMDDVWNEFFRMEDSERNLERQQFLCTAQLPVLRIIQNCSIFALRQ